MADRGSPKGITAATKFTTELREARLTLGRSQAFAAQQAGIDQSEWSRIEGGKRTSIPWEMAGRMAAVVDLDFVVQAYASDLRLRDAAQLALLRQPRKDLGPPWAWRYEVPLPDPIDQRAWDAWATHRDTGLAIRIEAETRLRDCQALLRRIEAKRISDGEPRVVLLVSATEHNRGSVHAAADILGTAFLLDTRRALAALRSGLDPGRDALIMVRVGKERTSQVEADLEPEPDVE